MLNKKKKEFIEPKIFAKHLRKRSTPAEEHFWQMVRNRKMLGLKIRRQHAIGPYIADFYCHELKLVIEIDGSIHNLKEVKIKDAIREKYFIGEELKVIRFTNADVFSNHEIIENALLRHIPRPEGG